MAHMWAKWQQYPCFLSAPSCSAWGRKGPTCGQDGNISLAFLSVPNLGGTNLTSRADGDHENGQKVSLLACVANSETHIKIQFPKTALWGPYFAMFHCQR